jgi:sarcosine oxidase
MSDRANGLNRRELLAGGLALGAVASASRAATGGAKPTAIVVGAGAFGGWSALHLLRRGYDVTLVDAWEAGHSRSSSGGETRVIRGSYGSRGIYTRLTARALELWRAFDRERGSTLLQPVGVLFLHGDDDGFVRDSLPHLAAAGLPHERVPTAAGVGRWPQLSWDGVRGAIWEPESGYLFARSACAEVAAAFVADGGRVLRATAKPHRLDSGRAAVALDSGEVLAADEVVFACGPWLKSLFPELLGDVILPSRQDVFFFGTPAGDDRFEPGRMPCWGDFSGSRLFYGIPGNHGRGFKIADDTRGPAFDPTTGDRAPWDVALGRARDYLARRFPDLAAAPLVEARVCQYENSADGDVVFDRHPGLENLWIVGGGSGHGFKFAPALGEHVARALAGETPPEPAFALSRFAAAGG